jgi:RNA recognition motif-containing protein
MLSKDLTTLFEEFGPLKNVSIAEKEGKPTGFGFVKL